MPCHPSTHPQVEMNGPKHPSRICNMWPIFQVGTQERRGCNAEHVQVLRVGLADYEFHDKTGGNKCRAPVANNSQQVTGHSLWEGQDTKRKLQGAAVLETLIQEADYFDVTSPSPMIFFFFFFFADGRTRLCQVRARTNQAPGDCTCGSKAWMT